MTAQDPYGRSDWRNPYGQYGPDPYGQHVQYGPDPYAQYAQDVYHQYAQALYPQPEPYRFQPYQAPYGPPRSAVAGPANAAIALNVFVGVFTCGMGLAWLPGIILGAAAVSRSRTDPATARVLTIAAWLCLVANFAVILLFFLSAM